jgi:hypothetical protein
MTPYLCDFAIDFDASTAYEASDVEELIFQVQTARLCCLASLRENGFGVMGIGGGLSIKV